MNYKENKMGTHKILPLLISMSLPPTISMMTSSLYNIVDSIFVASLGNEALTAVSLAFPIQILIIALAIGSGVGVNSYVARKLGEKNSSEADSAASHGIILSIIHYIILAFLGYIFIKPFFNIFTNNESIFKMGCDYAHIVTFLSFGIIMQIGIEKTLQATGNTLAPINRSSNKYYFRSNFNLWIFWFFTYGGKRCRYSNCMRTDFCTSMFFLCYFLQKTRN